MAKIYATIPSVPKQTHLDWNTRTPETPRNQWESATEFFRISSQQQTPGAAGSVVAQ